MKATLTHFCGRPLIYSEIYFQIWSGHWNLDLISKLVYVVFCPITHLNINAIFILIKWLGCPEVFKTVIWDSLSSKICFYHILWVRDLFFVQILANSAQKFLSLWHENLLYSHPKRSLYAFFGIGDFSASQVGCFGV